MAEAEAQRLAAEEEAHRVEEEAAAEAERLANEETPSQEEMNRVAEEDRVPQACRGNGTGRRRETTTRRCRKNARRKPRRFRGSARNAAEAERIHPRFFVSVFGCGNWSRLPVLLRARQRCSVSLADFHGFWTYSPTSEFNPCLASPFPYSTEGGQLWNRSVQQATA